MFVRFHVKSCLAFDDPVSHLCAGVLSDGAFDHSLMIVDEQARRRELLRPVLALITLARAREAVGRTAAELALSVDGRARGSQIDCGRHPLRKADQRRGVQDVARIWEIAPPALATMWSSRSN